jgi:hypothetical protein
MLPSWHVTVRVFVPTTGAGFGVNDVSVTRPEKGLPAMGIHKPLLSVSEQELTPASAQNIIAQVDF